MDECSEIRVPTIQCGWLDRPGCRLYYEVTGTGPALLFAHGLGSNHLTWWQQVPYFCGRYMCVAFAHRGYPPGSPLPGGPDPQDFADDLAALIAHLNLTDVRFVAQSMGGWSCLEYALACPQTVRALVLASTCGTIRQSAVPLADPHHLARWTRWAEATGIELRRRGIAPPAGARMACEQPALHFLYRAIANASATVDREALRVRLSAVATRPPDVLRRLAVPTLFLTGAEDLIYPPFLSDALAPLLPHATVAHVKDAGHSVYFERAAVFNRLVDDFLGAVG